MIGRWGTSTALLAAAWLISALATPAGQAGGANPQSPPNVVIVLADDLGYGDVSAYGATRLQTPNIDRLAREGVRFTDAHASAATCTPARYSLLTGQYAFRRPGTAILPGDAALIVDPGHVTLPSMLRRAGYATAIVGKWHLGLGPAGGPDWNGVIEPGPNEVGFDYAFIMPATVDRVPTVYVENHRVAGLDPADPIQVNYQTPVGDWPTGRDHPELLKMRPSHGHDQTIVNGISRIGYMTGGRAALWKDEDMADTFTSHALAFITEHRDEPFFLYYTAHEPHVPRVPNARFVGSTPMGPRGDAIVELDWSVGQILDTLDRLGLTDRTLVIFTSDNGPVLDDGYQDQAVEKAGSHRPAGPFRGGKYSIFEGGTRVPWIVRWPGHASPGVSSALVSQVDLLASLAALTGQTLPADERVDSRNVLPALLGTGDGRTEMIEEAGALALRQGAWKYIAPNHKAKVNRQVNIELGNDSVPQLYDLSADPGETHNLADAEPARTAAMAAALDRLR
jgi:arylsulfatase A-like enzyme